MFVGPDLGPNCLQRLSADDTSRQRVKILDSINMIMNYNIGLQLTVAADLGRKEQNKQK